MMLYEIVTIQYEALIHSNILYYNTLSDIEISPRSSFAKMD